MCPWLAVLSLIGFAAVAAPADGYAALMAEYRTALKAADAVFLKAATDEERKAVRADFDTWRTPFLGRVLAFVEAHPTDQNAVLALFFVLHPDTTADRDTRDRAVRLFLKDHAVGGGLTRSPILFLLGEGPLRAVLKANPHRSAQAHACVALGSTLKERADKSSAEQAVMLAAEAEGLFERVVTRYADVADMAAKAKAELFEIRHLAVGRAMPEIAGSDSDERAFKLSDYRGKVVVLAFWSETCVPCMKMVPHERALVKRLTGKPFALVGINLNETRDGLKRCEERLPITWRSFFDGSDGPIQRQHNLQKLPTSYVLDAKGVIRYKDLHGEEMDKAVDRLLAEMDEKK